MATLLTGKDLLGGAKKMRTSGMSTTGLSRGEKKLLMQNATFRRAIFTPEAHIAANKMKSALRWAKGATDAATGTTQTQFSSWRNVGDITRAAEKQALEQSTEAEKPSAVSGREGEGEGKKEGWEARLEEKRKEAERYRLTVEAEGKAEAAHRREIAKSGQRYARAQTIEEMKKERAGEEKQKNLSALARNDPKQLAKHAVDLGI